MTFLLELLIGEAVVAVWVAVFLMTSCAIWIQRDLRKRRK